MNEDLAIGIAVGFVLCYAALSILGRVWLRRHLFKKGSTARRPGQNSKMDVAEQVIAVIRR